MKRSAKLRRYRAAVGSLLLAFVLLFCLDVRAQLSAVDELSIKPAELVEAEMTGTATANVDASVWKTFSDNLVEALASENDGFKAGAMRLVIQYGAQLDVDDAAFDLVRIYRDHANERMRRMAVVAIGASGNEWALDFLRRSLRFEKSPAVLHTLASVIADYDSVPVGPAKQASSTPRTEADIEPSPAEPVSTYAETAVVKIPTAWSKNAGTQLAANLASIDPEVSDGALEQLIVLARSMGEVDLSAAVPQLVAIFASDPDPARRTAAVVALHAIGEEEGMQRVRGLLTHETVPSVLTAAIGALNDYYGLETFKGDEDTSAIAASLIDR